MLPVTMYCQCQSRNKFCLHMMKITLSYMIRSRLMCTWNGTRLMDGTKNPNSSSSARKRHQLTKSSRFVNDFQTPITIDKTGPRPHPHSFRFSPDAAAYSYKNADVQTDVSKQHKKTLIWKSSSSDLTKAKLIRRHKLSTNYTSIN